MICLPRRFRPHEIMLKLALPDNEDGNEQSRDILLKYVKVDSSYGVSQSKKGIQTDDKIIVYVELNDYLALENGSSVKYKKEEYSFDIKPGKDMLFYNGEEYLITALNEICTTSEYPVRLEIIGK